MNPQLKIIGVSHLGLAVSDLEKARWFFEDVLGLKNDGSEVVKDQKTLTQFFSFPDSKSPSPRLEALVSTSDDGPVAVFLQKKGSGIHHIALRVANLEGWLAHLKICNVQLIDENSRSGAHKTRVAFVHPRSTGGILVELVEEP